MNDTWLEPSSSHYWVSQSRIEIKTRRLLISRRFSWRIKVTFLLSFLCFSIKAHGAISWLILDDDGNVTDYELESMSRLSFVCVSALFAHSSRSAHEKFNRKIELLREMNLSWLSEFSRYIQWNSREWVLQKFQIPHTYMRLMEWTKMSNLR